MRIEVYGDWGYFSCDRCKRNTRVEIGDGLLQSYCCAYCGHQMQVTDSILS